jgi:hypothetical protein
MVRGRGFTFQESQRLLSGDARACAVGEVTWSLVNASWRGRVPVYGNGISDGEVFLEVQARPARPSEPTIVLLYRDECCRRLDVNQAHRNQRGTHIQGVDSSDDVERLFELPRGGFPEVPLQDTVDSDVYRQLLYAFASFCGIDTSAVEWTDPPEGRR